MSIPKNKAKRWIAQLHQGIGLLDDADQRNVMAAAGRQCAKDMSGILEKELGKRVESLDELVKGWNSIREKRNLAGQWKINEKVITGVFGECGCPLVASELIRLHSVQCYCSEAMIAAIFSEVAKKKVSVTLKHSIGRGDGVCEFIITGI